MLGKSRTAAVFATLITLAVLVVWYAWLFGYVMPDPGNIATKVRELTARQPFMWIFVLFPVFLLPRLFRSAFIAVRGESFTFDTLSRSVDRNGAPVASFAQVSAVQIRTMGEGEYRLSLILQGDGKVALGGADYEQICAIADALADLTGTKVVKKD